MTTEMNAIPPHAVPASEASVVAVRIPSGDDTLVGELHLPPGGGPNGRVPGIVVAGSWTTVRQQMATVYARRMAEAGFAALAVDFRHYGGSGGTPREFESPEHKIADVQAMAAWLAGHPRVAAGGVGGLAVCASAGYMGHAIARGSAIASWATVAGWMHDPSTVGLFYGGEEGVRRRIELGRAARRRWETTGVVDHVPAYDPANPDAAMFFEIDYYANPGRGAVPEWTNRFAVMGWEPWLTFDALAPAESIVIPTLQVHADGCALPDNIRRFQARLAGPRTLEWTEGTQTDFYDLDPFVTKAVAPVVDHFQRTVPGGRHAAAR